MKRTTPGQAAELRRAFDDSFARPAIVERERVVDLLAVRAGHLELALRVGELAGVSRCPRLTAVPGRNPALSGLAGVRGSLVAAYALATLLGEPGQPARGGWLALCKAERSVGLLFDDLVGYSRVPDSEIHQVVRIGGELRRMVDVSRLLETVGRHEE